MDKKLNAGTFLAATLLTLTAAAQAQVTNGGFETGNFTGWNVIGASTAGVVTQFPTSPLPSYIAPSQGSYMARIDAGGIGAGGDESAATIASGLNVSAGDLSGALGTALYGGGAIYQDIVVGNGDKVFFDWNFFNEEIGAGIRRARNDVAFFTLSDGSTKLVYKLAESTSVTALTQTGWSSFASSALAGGSYRIGFGVFNRTDEFLDSKLFVDGVSLQTSAVPEPGVVATGLVFGGGLGGMLLRRRRA
jgi:hypothetical protein